MSGRGARSGSGAKPMCPAVSSPLSPEGRGCVPSGGDQRKSSLLMGRLYHARVPADVDWPPRPQTTRPRRDRACSRASGTRRILTDLRVVLAVA